MNANASLPEVHSISIESVVPETADTKRLQFVNKNAEAPDTMLICKVYCSFEGMPKSQLPALYLGDFWVRKYFAFSRGIYFNIYDLEFVGTHANKVVRFSFDHVNFSKSEVLFSNARARTSAMGGEDSADSHSVPSKKDALRE